MGTDHNGDDRNPNTPSNINSQSAPLAILPKFDTFFGFEIKSDCKKLVDVFFTWRPVATDLVCCQ